MEKASRRVVLRWIIALALFALSFFGRTPAAELDWLFTSRGRLALLLLGLAVGFWPHISAWLKEQIIRVRPVSKRRLRREALELAKDMHAYASANYPASALASINEHQAVSARMEAASSDEERTAIWREYTDALTRQSLEETATLQQAFAGRLSFVLDEFERRGLLPNDPGFRSTVEWEARSSGWLGSAAAKIEGIARRL